MKSQISLIIYFIFSSFSLYYSQKDTTVSDTILSEVKKENQRVIIDKKINFNALLVGNYGASLTKNVDIYGKHNAEGVPSQNSFYIKYARVQAKMQITPNISGQILVNLADFKDNPQNKVLEIATVKYHINPYINLQVGQFRPYFGKEDMYSIDVNRSYYWSQQYAIAGSNHWQSFQIGAAFFGSLEKSNIPIKYFYTISNGNGKNQKEDNDNYKNHSFRVEYSPFNGVNIGVNSAFGKKDAQHTDAYGIDIGIDKKINNQWSWGIEAEYKQASNIVAFQNNPLLEKTIKNFRFQGVYITPYLHYTVGNHLLFDAIEFSLRYEYLDPLMSRGNPMRAYSPMLGFVIGDQYQSRISIIGSFIKYNTPVANTSQWNNNQFLIQYQFRY